MNVKQKLNGVLGLYDMKVALAKAISNLGGEVRFADIDESLRICRRGVNSESLTVDAVRVDNLSPCKDDIEILVHDEKGCDLGWLPLYMFNIGDTLVGLILKIRGHL